ncbi:hypothetical protein [Bacillus phage BillyBob]|nr:hypothetical protein [Bacillus phage BillyBob]
MEEYKIDDVFEDIDSSDLIYKIVAVAPKKDYAGEQAYLVEVSDGTRDIWYDARTDSYLNNYAIKL